MKNSSPFFTDMKNFCNQMLGELHTHGMLQNVRELDHACYRVSSVERYEILKRELETDCILLSEAFINGRPIATYRLNTTIKLNDGFSVCVLEVPAPKLGRFYQEGFEHVELVISESLEEFMARFPQLPFDKSNMKAPINRDVALQTKGGIVKFHESSLEQVIEEEQSILSRRQGPSPIVILDFDDTLVQSSEPFLRAIHQALQLHLGKDFPIEDIVAGARPTFPAFFANFGIHNFSAVEKIVKIFKNTWQKEVDHCIVPVGIQSMLSCFKSEGMRIILWTARDYDTTAEFIRNCGFQSYVESIYAFDAFGVSKPAPSAPMIEKINGAPCVVIGDSASDLEGSNRINARFIQATWVHHASLTAETHVICSSPIEAIAQTMKLLK